MSAIGLSASSSSNSSSLSDADDQSSPCAREGSTAISFGLLKYSSREMRRRVSSTGRSASSNGSSKNEGSCGPGGRRLYCVQTRTCEQGIRRRCSQPVHEGKKVAHVVHVQIPAQRGVFS